MINNSVIRRFEEIAERYPTTLAIQGANQHITYQQLANTSNKISSFISAQNIPKSARILLIGNNSPQMIEAFLGILKGGWVAVPLDVNVGINYLQRVIDLCSPAYIIFAEKPTELEQNISVPYTHISAIKESEIYHSSSSESNRDLKALSQETAYIYFTSGSTGQPKGILGLHNSLDQFIKWQRETFSVGKGDRVAQLTSPSFDVYLRDIFLPLTSGATIVVTTEKDRLPGFVFDWIDKENITIIHTVPSLINLWSRFAKTNHHLESVRYYFVAGEPLLGISINKWKSKFPNTGSFINLYGATETTLAKFFYRVPPNPPSGILPVGNPIPRCDFKVINELDKELPKGQLGEIVITTKDGTLGYVNPSENKERFLFYDSPGHISYRTGDLGFINPNGELVVKGRKDHQIKINGVRVEPEGISSILKHSKQVADGVVIARKNEEGSYFLIAYFVSAKEISKPKLDELLQFMASNLPKTHLPTVYVEVNLIPLNNRGKVDQSKLPTRTKSCQLNIYNDKPDEIAPLPRLADGAIEAIDNYFHQFPSLEVKVLEFGMGGSTLWFANRTNNLISVENDSDWFHKIKTWLKDHYADLRRMDLPLDKLCEDLPEQYFDLILIDNEDFDHGKMRIKCFQDSLKLLKPGGMIVFDNIDREKFKGVFQLPEIQDWQHNISTQTYPKKGYSKGSQTGWWLKPKEEASFDSLGQEDDLISIKNSWRKIWSKVLFDVKPKDTDRLLDLGADSLRIMEIAHLGDHLLPNIKMIYANPTLHELSELSLSWLQKKKIEKPFLEHEKFPLLPVQLEILSIPLYESFALPPRAYFLPKSYPIKKIRQMVQNLFEIFPVLRTSFDLSESQPQQYLSTLEKTDFSIKEYKIVASNYKPALKKIVEQHPSFNVEEDTLYRAIYVHLEHSDKNVLMFIGHHLLLDGISHSKIQSYILACLNADELRRKPAQPLGEFPELIKWSKHLHEYAHSAEVRNLNLDYWEKMSAENERTKSSGQGLWRSEFAFTKHDTSSAKSMVKSGISLSELILLSICPVLGTFLKKDDLILDWVSSGRESSDHFPLHQLVGCLYMITPLHINILRNEKLETRLDHLRKQIQLVNQQSIEFNCRRWINPKTNEEWLREKIQPDFSVNIQSNDYLNISSKENIAESIPLPFYAWNVSTSSLSKQVSTNIRFFFYFQNGVLCGYALGQKGFINKSAQNDLVSQVEANFRRIINELN